MSENEFAPAPPEQRPPSLTWTRFIVDYNPCFLLSAVCMLFGCRLLNDAVNTQSGNVGGALWLIFTINVYEFCLLGVATLIRRVQGLRRDVGILLIVGVLFLCDIAFVIGDLSTARPSAGLLVAGVLIGLAVLKTQIVLGLLDSPKRSRVTYLVASQLAIILLLPIVLKQVAYLHNGYLPPLAIYVGWWIAGALPIVIRGVLQFRTLQHLPTLARVYVIVPYVALLGHLFACTWVFKLPFYMACYAPVLLGLAVVFGMARFRFGRDLATALEWLLAAIAVLLALGAPGELAIGGTVNDSVTFSALRLTLIGAALVNLHGFAVLRHPLFAVTLTFNALGAMLGPSVPAMFENIGVLFRMIRDLFKRAVPQTAPQWGVVTVVVSFVLLGIGAALSLLRKPVTQNGQG